MRQITTPGTHRAPGFLFPRVAGIALTAVVLLTIVCAGPFLGATGTAEEPSDAGPREAVGVPDADRYPRTVVDALGREVSLPGPPARIVTAGRAVLMIADVLYAFETVPDRLVGVGRINQGRGSFLPVIDPGYGNRTILERNVGPEQIAALAPDLVVLKTFMRERLGSRLESLGIPVVYVELETAEQYRRDIRMLGSAVGEENRGRALAAFFEREASAIDAGVATIPREQRPTVLLLYYRQSDEGVSFDVPPASWMQTQLVTRAGGVPVWPDANPGGGWGTVSFEQIAAWDPETILIVSYDGRAAAIRDRLREDPRWQSLQAVSEERFHAFPTDYYSWDQPDTRWILGLRWLATRMHPERFDPADTEESVRRFFDELYGINETEFSESIQPMLTGDLP